MVRCEEHRAAGIVQAIDLQNLVIAFLELQFKFRVCGKGIGLIEAV